MTVILSKLDGLLAMLKRIVLPNTETIWKIKGKINYQGEIL